MNDLGISQKTMKSPSLPVKEEETEPALASLPNGETVTGKTSDLFGQRRLFSSTPSKLAHIDKETKLIEPEYVKPIRKSEDQPLGQSQPSPPLK